MINYADFASYPITLYIYDVVGTVPNECFDEEEFQLTINPDNTIALSSAAGTDGQTVCIDTALTNITYATTGATGATITGLPSGVTGIWSGDVVTISGTPDTTVAVSYTHLTLPTIYSV